jgi:hypothetical protein
MAFAAVNGIDVHVELHGSAMVALDPAVRHPDIIDSLRGES